MENKAKNFLQSAEWRKFQESVGKRTFFIEKDDFSASLIEHDLPIVGKYLYAPRGPLVGISNKIQNPKSEILNKFKIYFSEIIKLAKENDVGWIRVDPENKNVLNLIKENTDHKIQKAPHDMQPREIFVIDIAKTEEELLAEMKSKTRYNIKIAQKNVLVSVSREKKYVEEFLRLTKETAKRNGITSHPEKYYRKMIESLPEDILKIYVAEYDGKVIAANLVLFFDDTATYLHGASGNEYRNVMAPYLLQWQAILDAKKLGCKCYDFGGIKTQIAEMSMQNDWAGITKFKLGFSSNTKPLEFSGSYDIIIDQYLYILYMILQKVKELLVKMRK